LYSISLNFQKGKQNLIFAKNISMQKRKMITAALPYANGPVHIGHLAGVYIPADVYARFQRRLGNDVAFICGSMNTAFLLP
jgi:leucyl-tRNA synthetase